MLTPDDPIELDESATLQAELLSVYAQLDHMSAIAQALYQGVCLLIEALTPLPEVPGLDPVAVAHVRLTLRDAREALQLAENTL